MNWNGLSRDELKTLLAMLSKYGMEFGAALALEAIPDKSLQIFPFSDPVTTSNNLDILVECSGNYTFPEKMKKSLQHALEMIADCGVDLEVTLSADLKQLKIKYAFDLEDETTEALEVNRYSDVIGYIVRFAHAVYRYVDAISRLRSSKEQGTILIADQVPPSVKVYDSLHDNGSVSYTTSAAFRNAGGPTSSGDYLLDDSGAAALLERLQNLDVWHSVIELAASTKDKYGDRFQFTIKDEGFRVDSCENDVPALPDTPNELLSYTANNFSLLIRHITAYLPKSPSFQHDA